jgi:hypothetical protein
MVDVNESSGGAEFCLTDIRVSLSVDRANYLSCLNQAFGDWGGEALFDWGFSNTPGLPETRFIQIYDQNEPVAGSAVTFHVLECNSQRNVAGIMSGSWTLPAWRRKGCLTAFIHESFRVVQEVGANVLFGVMMETNPSYRRWEKVADFLVPSHYCFYEPQDEEAAQQGAEELQLQHENEKIVAFIRGLDSSGISDGKVRFSFGEQHRISRYAGYPGNEAVYIAQDSLGQRAVINENASTLKVTRYDISSGDAQTLFHGLKQLARARKKKAYVYTTEHDVMNVLRDSGFVCKKGYFTALVNPAQKGFMGAHLRDNFVIHNGDKS